MDNNLANPNRTNHARIQYDLLKRIKQLEKDNKQLKEVNDAIIHILSTPFDMIEHHCRTIAAQHATAANPQLHAQLEKIHRCSSQGKSLLKDLIAYSRASITDIHWREIDLSAMAEEVLAALREAAPTRKAELSIQPGLKVQGDSLLLRLLLMNLLGNAWKYTAKTAIARIEFFGHESKYEVEFGVRDNGIGFDPIRAERLFDLFQRYCDDPDFAGTGIGLATAACVAARHNGKIRAEGVPGAGASFYVVLPKRRPPG